jgi:hypothetical protein
MVAPPPARIAITDCQTKQDAFRQPGMNVIYASLEIAFFSCYFYLR